MKLDTALMLSKLAVYTLVGGLVPTSTALQQWINDGSWPPRINWIGIGIGFGIGAGNAFLSFFSSSYANWKTTRNGGGTQFLTNPTKTP